MEKMSFVKPINCDQIKNLSMTEYFIIYLDKNNKLKRAIPDFNESIISYEDSLIDEAFNAERCGLFKLLTKREFLKSSSPKFSIYIDENGTINKYTEEEVKLNNLLLDKKTRENISKILKKKR